MGYEIGEIVVLGHARGLRCYRESSGSKLAAGCGSVYRPCWCPCRKIDLPNPLNW